MIVLFVQNKQLIFLFQELLNKCHKNMEIIISAKDRQAAEANKNASILLEQIDLEKEREELKKAAAARKRDKKKQKKKKKLQAEKDTETNVKNMAEKENSDDSSEPERKVSAENGGKCFFQICSSGSLK